MKKKLTLTALAILMSFITLTVPVFACGLCRGGNYNSKYNYCNYSSCSLNYKHMHNGLHYHGHTMNDGHNHKNLIYTNAIHH